MDDWEFDIHVYTGEYRPLIGDYWLYHPDSDSSNRHIPFQREFNRINWAAKDCHPKICSKNFVEW